MFQRSVYCINDLALQVIMTENGYQVFNERPNQVEDPCSERVCFNVFRMNLKTFKDNIGTKYTSYLYYFSNWKLVLKKLL